MKSILNMESIHQSLLSTTSFGISVVFLSACSFYIFSRIVESWLTPAEAQHCSWRWKNIFVSFGHSLLSGCWALLCFFENPQMAEDLISTYTSFSYCLVAVSVGYFVHDTFDMLIYSRGRQTSELLLHHIVILVCFGIAITTQVYVGYAVVALIVEVNSIFLHTRQLLQILGVPKDSSIYRTNSLIVLATYIAFRISTLAWMTRWIVVNRDLIPLTIYTIGSVGLAIMTLMNIILFYRLLQSDFLRKNKKSEFTNTAKED